MNWIDVAIIIALALWLFIAIRHIIRRKGGCGGDCDSCPYRCDKKKE